MRHLVGPTENIIIPPSLLVYLFLSMPVQLFLHVFLKYIYVYFNKSINSYVCLLFINVSFISTITCPIIIHLYNYTNEAFIYISVLLHYNCKNNANIQVWPMVYIKTSRHQDIKTSRHQDIKTSRHQDVYHRPNLERAQNVGCRLFYK